MAAVAGFRYSDTFPENIRGHGGAPTILLRCRRGNLQFALVPSDAVAEPPTRKGAVRPLKADDLV